MGLLRKILTVVLSILAAIFITVAITACDDASYNKTQVNEDPETGEITYVARGITFHVVEIDGCEYLVGHYSGGSSATGYMSHKGNCKYCEERRRAEQY